jgi:hypothetical protein
VWNIDRLVIISNTHQLIWFISVTNTKHHFHLLIWIVLICRILHSAFSKHFLIWNVCTLLKILNLCIPFWSQCVALTPHTIPVLHGCFLIGIDPLSIFYEELLMLRTYSDPTVLYITLFNNLDSSRWSLYNVAGIWTTIFIRLWSSSGIWVVQLMTINLFPDSR